MHTFWWYFPYDFNKHTLFMRRNSEDKEKEERKIKIKTFHKTYQTLINAWFPYGLLWTAICSENRGGRRSNKSQFERTHTTDTACHKIHHSNLCSAEVNLYENFN